jgi:hypothetical protein
VTGSTNFTENIYWIKLFTVQFPYLKQLRVKSIENINWNIYSCSLLLV